MSKIKTCVSLYSLQDEYLNKRMSLEDIMWFVKESKAEGVEILPDQMLHGAPDISDETLERWNKIIKETELKPVIADVFLNTNIYKNRELTHKECVELLVKEIKQADKLGIRLIRLVSMVPYWVLEPLLPYCEQYNVTVALEIHAAMAFDIQETREFIEEMKRLNSTYIGLVIDTGIFCRRFPRVVKKYELNNGASKEIFDYIDALFEKGTDFHKERKKNDGKFPEDFIKTMKTEEDHMFAHLCDGYENYSYDILDEYMPYIKHFHFKLFEMTEEGPEYSMDYKGLLQYLHEHNYDGYVATEYEGNRFTLPGTPMAEKEQVSANQKYIRECLKEIQG
ncbi:sugar phosphate isomerase/epimerase family protein [Clostridium intestinale]|uniref:sugar phosphate isomerase/epimerase family protein n=1 Tax=Clostridium intestinale TaxID=36845 RepID=UPI002DD676B4|nr:TIM barrel protein [Clostridium intestinale]WRY51447.1 TIM barrel protein [Clostridium intestinale]